MKKDSWLVGFWLAQNLLHAQIVACTAEIMIGCIDDDVQQCSFQNVVYKKQIINIIFEVIEMSCNDKSLETNNGLKE